MSRTTIATCAFPGTYDIAKSLELHLTYIKEAAAAGAQLVVFPETSLQGYPPVFDPHDPGAALESVMEVAERVPDGPNVSKLIEAARAHKIHVVFGLTELGDQAGVLYNTMVLAGPEGYIGSFRKVHVGITEQVFWRRGNEWPVFETPLGKIGMLICYDKMWPESCRELTLSGADILVMSTAWSYLPGQGEGWDNLWVRQYELLDRVRAVENARWFISSNLIGELGGLEFFGLSEIVDPTGEVVASSGLDGTGLVLADVDIAGGIARAALTTQGSFLIRDRRPETYRTLSGMAPLAVDG